MRFFPTDITAAIVAHNARGYLAECLASLRDAGCPDEQILVVDVASTDGLVDWLAHERPAIEVVRLARNDGPSPGRNVGIRHRETRYVLLLDADVQLEPDAVRILHEAMEADPSVAIGSPIVVRAEAPETIQYADTALHYICEAVNPYLDAPLASRGDDWRRIRVASTCALLLRRSMALHIGPFDERYFIGKEDGDFTHRAILAGYTILEIPSARVRHRSKPRSDWLFYYQIRNRWHFMLKNYELWTLVVIAPPLVLHELLQAALLVAKGHLVTYLKAVGGLVALLPVLPEDRELATRIRVVHDRDVLVSGSFIVRSDLAGGPLRFLLRSYAAVLTAYWRIARHLLPGRS